MTFGVHCPQEAMWHGRSLLLVSVLFAAVLRQPAPTRAWRADDLDLDLDHDHDLDLDLDHDHDDLDLDDADFLRKGGIKRLRMPARPRPARASGAGDGAGAGAGAGDGAGDGIEGWDADLEKMLHAESPWLPGADGRESYEEFLRRFSSEAPGEEQDDWD
ncbi:hypothetical protein R5R35_003080 [Gryllus longicercus]|uniref:Uncharacterized protein n=1 Tax=Gryllus longicercus TaxID=2509291 RepID=A0AAN9VJD9_9ORTH